MNKEKPNWYQQAMDRIDEVEGTTWNCEAMRERVCFLNEAGFDPHKHILVEKENGDLSIEFKPDASKDKLGSVMDPDGMAGHPLEPKSPGDSFKPELITEPVVVFEG